MLDQLGNITLRASTSLLNNFALKSESKECLALEWEGPHPLHQQYLPTLGCWDVPQQLSHDAPASVRYDSLGWRLLLWR
jgi:hypothetical protein